jgi:phage baseplate assembly protein W
MKNIVDVNTAFNRNIITNSVSSVSDKHAIAQYIYNLLNTQTLEIPFKEWQGSGLMALLGEACTNITASIISEQIRVLVTKYVPYVELQNITYYIDPDNQKYIFILYYTILNNPNVVEQTLEFSTTI